MTGKITAALVAAILLGSAGVAPAQVGGPTYGSYYGPYYSPYYNSYYNGTYWRGIRNVAPYSGNNGYDPLRGTNLDDVAPY
jgi:hypothetical protein